MKMTQNKIGISDLVEISEKPEAFIVLTRAVEENPEDTVGTYVVTEDIMQHVSSILSQIQTGKGKGFCVQGFPGSGKSHFLSFMTLLLKDKEVWDHSSEDVKRLRREFYDHFEDRNFLTMYFSLTEGADLKVSLYEEAEKRGVELVQAKKIHDNFFVSRSKSINWDDFYHFVKETEGLDKDQVTSLAEQKDKTSIAEIIVKYNQSRGISYKERSFREVLYPPILDGVDYILDYAGEKELDGAVVFVDELSQYLKERRERGKMEIDISLLRSLEDVFRSNKPFWFIGAAHEDISKLMGYALDRFEPLIQSKIDIRHILARRIAKKKPGSKGNIEDIYHEFSLLFPGFSNNVTLDEFRDLYPFHKAFVENAILLAQEASRMRSMVLVCWECLSDIKNAEQERPEDKDVHNLVTLDVLYDKFLLDPRIRKKYDKYFNVYEDFFKTDIIPKLERNQKLAHRLIKSLIILAITGKDRVSVKDITHILLERLYKLEKTDVNYQGVKDTLDELKKLSLDKYLSVSPVGKDPLDYAYYIDITKVGVTLEEEIRAEIDKLRDRGDDALKRTLKHILNTRESLFKKASIEEMETPLSKEVSWRNTPRKGKIKLALPGNIRSIPQLEPEKDDIDFAFIVSTPFHTTQDEDIQKAQKKLRKCNDPRIFFWLPREMNEEEKESLRRYEAIRTLQEKYEEPRTTQEREKAAELPVKFSYVEEEVESIVERLYRSKAVIYNASGKLPLRLTDYLDATEIIEKSIKDALNLHYCEHPKYRAGVSRTQTNRLIRGFIKEGRTDRRTNQITNYAEPLGIVGDNLELDAEKSKYVKTLLDNIPEKESVDVDKLFNTLRGARYGIQDFSFEVLLAAMIKQGLITGYTREGNMFDPKELENVGSGRDALINVVQTVEKGKMINFPEPWASVVKILETIHPEVKTTPYSTATQNEMWKTAKKKTKQEQEKLNLTKEQMEKLVETTESNESADILDPIQNLLGIYNEIKLNLDPKKGLERMYQQVIDEYTDIKKFRREYNSVDQLKKFCEKRKDEALIQSYNYLKTLIEGYEGLENIKDLQHGIDASLLQSIWERFTNLKDLIYDVDFYDTFIQDYQRFIKSYAKAYAGSHSDYYTRRKTFNAKLDQIRESQEYNTLKLLSTIKKIKSSPSFQDLKEELDEKLSTCDVKGLYGRIKSSPFCECGYKIGDKETATTEEIEKPIRKGILACVEMLQQRATRKRILGFVDEEPIPILKKQNITKLLMLEISKKNVDTICNLLDDEVVKAISDALKDAVYISSQEVVQELAGSYSLAEIMETTQKKLKNLAERKIEEEGKSTADKDLLIVIARETEG